MLQTIHPLVQLALCLAWLIACLAVFDLRLQLATILAAATALMLLDRVPPLLVLALMLPLACYIAPIFNPPRVMALGLITPLLLLGLMLMLQRPAKPSGV